MIVLRTLGALELRAATGGELQAVLAQPKRLALLVYLALATPGSFHRRDALLGLFWPESDEQRARVALRQAVRFLRRNLGDGALISRSREELGIAPDTLWCDALQLRVEISRGEDARALELYRGDFLPGFFVSDAPEFERWLEEERAELRGLAAAAAWTLAESAECDGDPEAATQWARRAVELSPDDERAVCRLVVLLDRLGNRSAAIRVFEEFAERLRDEYGLDPSPEATALVEAIRSRTTGSADVSGRMAGQTLYRDAAIPLEEASEDPDPAALSTLREERSGDGAAAPLNPERILVAVLENRTGDPSLDPLGSMAADWIAQGLSQVGIFQVVPLAAAMVTTRFVSGIDAFPAGQTRVRAMALEQGAGTVVSGAYYADGEGLQFHARITNVAQGSILRAIDPIRAPRDSPLTAIEALRAEVMTSLTPLLDPRISHVQAATRPPSYDAYRLYIEGLEHFIRGDWRRALPFFQRAASVDRDYLLPLIVSAITHWNLGELTMAGAVAQEAARSRDRLGQFERAVLDMVLAWLCGDWAAAHEAVSRQARLAPGSIPSVQVAEEARRLNRPGEAVRVLSSLDPMRGELRGWFFYWVELTQAYHMLGRHRQELRTARRARNLFPDHSAALLLEIRALAALGQSEDVCRCINERLSSPQQQDPSPGALMREAALELRAHGQPEIAQQLFQRSLEWYLARPADQRKTTAHHRDLARAYYYAESWEDARQVFTELSAGTTSDHAPIAFHHGHLQGHLDQGFLGALAARRNDWQSVKQITDALEGLQHAYLFGSHTYWRAAITALAGDTDQAVTLLRQAFAEGLPHELFIHTDVNLESLRSHPSFKELTRPGD